MTTNNIFVIKNILVIVITFYKTKKVSKSCLMSIYLQTTLNIFLKSLNNLFCVLVNYQILET